MMNHAVITTTEASRTSQREGRDDIPMDVLLPQLSMILDKEAMRKTLWDGMFESASDRDRFLIRHCDIIQVRYKPASSCMVSYRLNIENVATGERGEQILCGRAFPKGRSQPQWEKASTRALVQPRFGKPLIHLPEIEMVLWGFPNDRKMHTLPAAIDAALSTSNIPPSWLLSHLGTGWQVADTKSRVMHYVGEHTCTVQTSFDLIQPSQGTRQTLTLFGKTYYNEEGAQTDLVMRQLWNSEARRSGGLGVAQPLWYDARLRTLWQVGIQGTTLENHSIETPAGIPLLKKAAHTIATFHTTPLSHIPPNTMLQQLGKLDAVASILMQCRPSCRPLLVPLRDRLIAQARIISLGPTATLHGDLHMKNLFLTHDRIALIDLDNVCQGHPGQDIGSFVAGLLTGTLAKQVAPSRITHPVQVFLDHYNQCTPWNIDQPTLAWFTAMALVTERSYRCVTRLKDGRLGMLEVLLNLAHEISTACALPSPTDELPADRERNGGS
jgi:Phosphotransferase enzyme family